jgi:Cdc6-like AAA superfamily ATPase
MKNRNNDAVDVGVVVDEAADDDQIPLAARKAAAHKHRVAAALVRWTGTIAMTDTPKIVSTMMIWMPTKRSARLILIMTTEMGTKS